MKTIRKMTLMLVLGISLIACNADQDEEPVIDCYQLARMLEREQFEAWQQRKSLAEIEAIRDRFEREYPDCRWR